MLLAEEKASWLLELSENSLFSRGKSNVDLVFELNHWALILTEKGGHLIYLPIAAELFDECTKSFQVLSVLEKLPGTKNEFYSMLELIKENGTLINDSESCEYYCCFNKNRLLNWDLVGILKSFNLKAVLNKRERLKFAIKTELIKDYSLTPRLIIFWAILNFLILVLIFLSFSKLSIFNFSLNDLAKNFDSYIKLFYVAVLYVSLSFLNYFLFIFTLRRIQINRIFKSMDKLGVDFYKIRPVDIDNLRFVKIKLDMDTIIKINNKKRDFFDVNFIN
mgnify:CR=1 FL=1